MFCGFEEKRRPQLLEFQFHYAGTVDCFHPRHVKALTVLFVVRSLFLFLGREFGVLRPLRECLFVLFCGQQCGVGFSQLIILLRGVLPLSTGVVCVGVVGNWWIIFCYVVSLVLRY